MQVLKVDVNAVEVISALDELGLTSEKVENFVRAGQSARVMATDNHPANAGGTLAYFEVVKSARDYLLSQGWEKSASKI